MLLAFHKSFGVISQFTPDGSSNRTLAEFKFPKGVYPIGRLDADSEGLLLLSDEAALNQKLLHPKHGHERIYWAQVENIPGADTLRQLERGVVISRGHKTLPARAWLLEPQPEVPPRTPPVRFRKSIPTAWIGFGTRRRQKPPGAPDDGGHRPPHAAFATRAHRWLRVGKSCAG